MLVRLGVALIMWVALGAAWVLFVGLSEMRPGPAPLLGLALLGGVSFFVAFWYRRGERFSPPNNPPS